MVERVHHIDFVVRDLDAATARYSSILGVEPRSREELPDRGIHLVRFEVGGIWIILVQPVRDDSPVRAFLDRYGEGFYAESVSRVPEGPTSGRLRVKRGGAWMSQPSWVRTAYRGKGSPTSRNADHGFRCARDVPEG